MKKRGICNNNQIKINECVMKYIDSQLTYNAINHNKFEQT